MLHIVPSCNLVQYQGKLIMWPWENGKSPGFGSNFGTPKVFSCVLPLLVVRQCSKLSSNAMSGKLMNQTWENKEKPNFGPDFAPFGPNLALDFFHMNFTSTGC